MLVERRLLIDNTPHVKEASLSRVIQEDISNQQQDGSILENLSSSQKRQYIQDKKKQYFKERLE